MGTRTKARECAFQMLYQWDVTREPMDRVAGLFWQVRSSTPETRAMAERLARGGQAEVERLDEAITAASTNWRFERIAAVDRNILRIGAYELMKEPQTPSKVIIDEAVEMAKRFGEADSPPFVNGVLDAVMRQGPRPARRGPVSDEPPVEGWPAESAQRLEKAAALRERGVNPYPNRFERTHGLAQINAEHGGQGMEELEALGKQVRIAGRVMTLRGHGKASFATLSDGEARLQVYVRQDDVGEAAYRMLDLVDLGDYVGVAGTVMRTRKGELSVQAKELIFLSKALLPPPEKWHGLADVEARYRQRYVDLMANPEVRQTFVARSAMVSQIRRFLDERGYIEVETPMMQPVPGGAVARPFTTHHNALGMDLYLRIAPELYLKRLVVGGLEKVYEINRNFRNEGISSMHNPEFTMLEFYTAHFDCRDVMALTEELITTVAGRVSQGRSLTYKGREVGLVSPFKRISMIGAVAEVARDQGWGIGAKELADPTALEAWLRSAPKPSALPAGSRELEGFTSDVALARYEPSPTGSASPSSSSSTSSGAGTRRGRGCGARPSSRTTRWRSRRWPRRARTTRAGRTASSCSWPGWRWPTASRS
jgi:lysyl-tRNA synthetase/transcription antitermination factor NusB